MKIEIFDPPRDAAMDVKVHGYNPNTREYLVQFMNDTDRHVPASEVILHLPDDDDEWWGPDGEYDPDYYEEI
jgi:hypothetical protein